MILKNNYTCVLDIGSSKIVVVVAALKKNRIEQLWFDTIPSKGVRNGMIVDSIALTGCISSLLKGMRQATEINIKYVNVNISGLDIVTKHSRAIVPLAERGNKVITFSDVMKVSETARVLGSSLDEETIHSIPFSYAIDSKRDVLNPVGLYSHRLEVDLYMVCGKLSSIQSIARAVHQSGFEVKDLYFSGLASSSIIMEKEQRKGLAFFCDIGSDITEILIFNDGVLRDVKILPLGGNVITQALARSLKIPFELAEDVKRSYGIAGAQTDADETKELLVKQGNAYHPIKQKIVVEITTQEARGIALAIKESIADIITSHKITNFTVTGRSIFLEGFLELLEHILGIPIKLGKISDHDIAANVNKHEALSGQKYLTYITALGLLYLSLHTRESNDISRHQLIRNPFLRVINKTKEIYQEYF